MKTKKKASVKKAPKKTPRRKMSAAGYTRKQPDYLVYLLCGFIVGVVFFSIIIALRSL